MKKETIEKDVRLSIARKRHWRGIRKKATAKNQSRLSRGRKRQQRRNSTWHADVKAPPKINLYVPSDHEKTVEFLKDLRFKISRNSRVRISFRDTTEITAAGGLLFIAELDRLITAYPGVKFSCIRPPIKHDRTYGNESYVTESVLNQIGFFKLTGLTEKNLPAYPSVSCWKHSQGHIAEGQIAGQLLNHVNEQLAAPARKRLYRGAIEAISNCVEHAYPSLRRDGLQITDKRWWMFVGVMMGRLVVCVCDLGVGIPATVTQKNPKELVQTMLEKLGVTGTRDSEWIYVATLISRSRTDQKHRGKGGKDIRELLEYYKGARLSIFSNKGCFRDWNKAKSTSKAESIPFAMTDEQKKSIHGTIIEWTVPLEELSV
ncbi:hypothetical protein [Marinobacter salarius]|uniref:hypothetical protein n=1 Tax=Marinobacter salarius TaxID=1420917 RepID=UPI000F84F94F|nr:hypothetical protein [Marinobacter salarius]AZR42985.1 hypothetical protein MTMN5_03552 [Marinobacter salarius]